MFKINKEDQSVNLTRGDACVIGLKSIDADGNAYTFRQGEVIRLSVYGKKDCDNVVLQKDYPITADSEEIALFISSEETKFGKIINKPTDYWYEVELNPGPYSQTLIGYDNNGPKLFRIYPEGEKL